MNNLDWKIISDLYNTHNITKTAQRLFLTQPTVSKKLQQIEKEYGVKLVMRIPKGVVFTPEGEYIAKQAAEILRIQNQTKKTLLEIGDGTTGTLHLGMTNAFVRFTISEYIKRYNQLYPKIKFNITTGVSAEISQALEDHKIHVGFIRGETSRNFEQVLINVEQAYLANKTEIELTQLPFLPRVDYVKDPFARNLINSWWNERFQAPPNVAMNVNHGDTSREMVANGHGYGIFLSPRFLENAKDLFRMPLYYLDGKPLVRASYMVWQAEYNTIPIIRNFIDYMKSEIEN